MMVAQHVISEIKVLLKTNVNSFDDAFSLKDGYQTIGKAKQK